MASQVFDMKISKGMSRGQSNEHLRNFSERAYEEKRTRNFDPTREDLNFEVTNDGWIVPLQKNYPIDKRIKDSLQKRGIKDPNEGKAMDDPKRRNTHFDIIFQGSRDQMRKLAFGSQEIDEGDVDHAPDNRAVERMPEIELWAKDMHDFACKKFGRDNVVAFVCHLDELNPHIHCTVIPTGIIKGKERVSTHAVVGNGKYAFKKWTTRCHDELAEVNAKWGLERGKPISETGAKHRTTEQYWKDLTAKCTELEEKQDGLKKKNGLLAQQIAQHNRAIAGLTTMLENLNSKKDAIEDEIRELDETKSDEKTRLVFQLSELQEKIDNKKKILDDKETDLRKLQEIKQRVEGRIDVLNTELRRVAPEASQKVADEVSATAWNVAREELQKYREETEEYKQQAPPEERKAIEKMEEEVDGSIIEDMAERGNEIVSVAGMLFLGYLDAAGNIAKKSGGGGDAPKSGWGKNEDEDDRLFMARCVHTARQMCKPQERIRKNTKRL